jgi:hypothetical protein
MVLCNLLVTLAVSPMQEIANGQSKRHQAAESWFISTNSKLLITLHMIDTIVVRGSHASRIIYKFVFLFYKKYRMSQLGKENNN